MNGKYSEVSIKRTVSTKHTGQTDFQMFLLSVLYNLKIWCKPLIVQVSIKRTGYHKVFKTQSKIAFFGP